MILFSIYCTSCNVSHLSTANEQLTSQHVAAEFTSRTKSHSLPKHASPENPGISRPALHSCNCHRDQPVSRWRERQSEGDRERERKRDRERLKERQRERDKEKERQRDRETETERDRERDRERETARDRERERDRERNRVCSLQTHGCSEQQPCRHSFTMSDCGPSLAVDSTSAQPLE
ncbi:hypothetical protein FHG87_006525 [Trinorchestia longiramus]|nr:hypothetical protein FHG87_006525 [Trinorchestia longiramus]